jgi:hypothetical protein
MTAMEPFTQPPSFCNITDGVAWGGNCIHHGSPVFLLRDLKKSGPWLCSDCILSIMAFDANFQVSAMRFQDWLKTVGKKKNEHPKED